MAEAILVAVAAAQLLLAGHMAIAIYRAVTTAHNNRKTRQR